MILKPTRRRRTRATLVAVAGLGLALAAPASAYAALSPSAPLTVPAAVPQCQTGHLSGSLKDDGGAAGSVIYSLTLKNTGPSSCRIGGFPGVSYQSARHGHQVGAAATRDGSPHGWVTLAPGHSAAAVLQEVDPLNFPSATCHLTPVAGLRVYPPNQTAWLFVGQRGHACANRSLTQLTVQAF